MRVMTDQADFTLPQGADPKLAALYDLWLARRKSRRWPARADFDVIEFKPWMGWLALLDVIEGGGDLRFRVFPSLHAQRIHMDLTNQTVRDNPRIRDMTKRSYFDCIATGRPIYGRLAEDISAARFRYAWNRIILPLGATDAAVDMIMVCVTEDYYTAF